MMSPARVAAGNRFMIAFAAVVAFVPPWLMGSAEAKCEAVTWPEVLMSVPVYATVPPVPKATEEVSVPVKVSVLLIVKTFELASVNVPVEVVTVKLLRLVAVAAPRIGVTRVGDVARTKPPVPVRALANTAVSVPVVVTGELDTVKSTGRDNPTLVTVPLPPLLPPIVTIWL